MTFGEEFSVHALNRRQQAKLRRIEKDSFADLCERLGSDPREREALLLLYMKREAQRIAKNIAPEIAEESGVNFILAATSYWEAKRDVDERARRSTVESIVNAAPNLASEIDYGYLRNLANRIGLEPPEPHTRGRLRSLLLAIPEIMQFDMKFNAFVEGRSRIGGLPCICAYEQLVGAVTGIAEIVPLMIMVERDDNSVDPAPESHCAEIGRSPDGKRVCNSCFEMVFGSTDSIEHWPNSLAASEEADMQTKLCIRTGALRRAPASSLCVVLHRDSSGKSVALLKNGSASAIESIGHLNGRCLASA